LSKINKKAIGKKGIENILRGAFRHNFEVKSRSLNLRRIFHVLKEQVAKKKMASKLIQIENKFAKKFISGNFALQKWKQFVIDSDEITKYKDRLSLAQA
jgi:hypothetical protein